MCTGRSNLPHGPRTASGHISCASTVVKGQMRVGSLSLSLSRYPIQIWWTGDFAVCKCRFSFSAPRTFTLEPDCTCFSSLTVYLPFPFHVRTSKSITLIGSRHWGFYGSRLQVRFSSISGLCRRRMGVPSQGRARLILRFSSISGLRRRRTGIPNLHRMPQRRRPGSIHTLRSQYSLSSSLF